MPNGNSTNPFTCDMGTYVGLTVGVYPMAIIVFIILAVMTNRGQCCWNHGKRPQCIYPVNMLDGYKHRLGYACIFGAMTVQLIDVLLQGTTLSGAVAILDLNLDFTAFPLLSPFIKALTLIFNVGLIAMAFYPLFICISTDYRFIGSILGIICTTYRLGVGLWTVATCQQKLDYYGKYAMVKYNTLFYNTPSLLCLAGLMAKYCYVAFKCIRKRRFLIYPKKEVLAEKHHILHVQRLLGPTPLPWQEENLHSMSIFNPQKFKATFFYKKTPYFRFPTRLVATFVILIAATYQVGLMVIFTVWSYIRRLQKEIPATFESLVGPALADYLKAYIGEVARWLQIASDLWIAVTCITVGTSIVYLYHATICYKKHVYRVYRGDRSMFPTSWTRQASQNIVTNAVRYAGLQVAYFMWGFVLIQVVLYLVILVITYIIIIPAAEFGYYDILTFVATIVIIPALISMGIFYSQVILARYLFLQPKVNATDTAVPLAVNNRHVYYNVSFFYFFFNIFLGIVSAILRVLKGMMLGVFFIPRIDRSVMMRGYEPMDSGFMCYLSVLTVTGAHDHPVVRMFLQILWDGAADRRNGEHPLPVLSRKSRIARRNWQLAYTLINNPDVIRYRKTHTKLEDIDDMGRHRIVVAERKKKEGTKTSELYAHAVAYEATAAYTEYPSRTSLPYGPLQQQQRVVLHASSRTLAPHGSPC